MAGYCKIDRRLQVLIGQPTIFPTSVFIPQELPPSCHQKKKEHEQILYSQGTRVLIYFFFHCLSNFGWCLEKSFSLFVSIFWTVYILADSPPPPLIILSILFHTKRECFHLKIFKLYFCNQVFLGKSGETVELVLFLTTTKMGWVNN